MAEIGMKFCPECDGENIIDVVGGVTGEWTCVDCGYVGICPEKHSEEEDNMVLKDLKESMGVKSKAVGKMKVSKSKTGKGRKK
jgi:hypothetical protein